MNLIYASLLLHSAKKPITEENIKKIVEAIGEKADDAQIKALVSALEGINIDDAISKATSVPVAVSATTQTQPVEVKAEEDKEKKAEEAAEGLGALFG